MQVACGGEEDGVFELVSEAADRLGGQPWNQGRGSMRRDGGGETGCGEDAAGGVHRARGVQLGVCAVRLHDMSQQHGQAELAFDMLSGPGIDVPVERVVKIPGITALIRDLREGHMQMHGAGVILIAGRLAIRVEGIAIPHRSSTLGDGGQECGVMQTVQGIRKNACSRRRAMHFLKHGDGCLHGNGRMV